MDVKVEFKELSIKARITEMVKSLKDLEFEENILDNEAVKAWKTSNEFKIND